MNQLCSLSIFFYVRLDQPGHLDAPKLRTLPSLMMIWASKLVSCDLIAASALEPAEHDLSPTPPVSDDYLPPALHHLIQDAGEPFIVVSPHPPYLLT